MFGKKQPQKKVETDTGESNYNIKSMPKEFYGGMDPEIKFKKVKKEVDLNKLENGKLRKKEIKAVEKVTSAGGTNKIHPANLLSNWKMLLFFGGVVFLFVVLVGASYYGYKYYKLRKIQAIITPTVVIPNIQTIPDIEKVTTTVEITTSTEIVPTTTPVTSDLIDYPSLLLGFGVDLDGDKLADKAEVVFGTDASIVDSDSDKYDDGHEVFYLYNPAGKEPKRLVDSQYVDEYINSNYNYSLYYPISWTIGNIDANYSDVLFTSITGESVRVKVYNKVSPYSFNEWLAAMAPTEKFSNLESISNVFREQGYMRDDKLVFYFDDANYIYVIAYKTGNDNIVNYAAVIEMMGRSFRSSENNFIKQWPVDSNTSTTSATTTITETATTTTTVDTVGL